MLLPLSDEAYSQNGKILVHCWAGVSRSATIVAAYLLKHTKLNVLQTITFLQSKRPIVEPNFNFLGQLERYFCDLERGVESRSKDKCHNVEQLARKLVAEQEKLKEQKLSSNSSSSSSPNTPPPKPYFNFIKWLYNAFIRVSMCACVCVVQRREQSAEHTHTRAHTFSLLSLSLSRSFLPETVKIIVHFSFFCKINILYIVSCFEITLALNNIWSWPANFAIFQ